MLVNKKGIDLGKSFGKLLDSLRESEQIFKAHHSYSSAQALGYLQGAVKLHIGECTDIDLRELYPKAGSELEKEIIAETEKNADDVSGVL